MVKYTNCNLLEHGWITTGIRTLEAQIDEKSRNIVAPQNVTGSYEKKSVMLNFSFLTYIFEINMC